MSERIVTDSNGRKYITNEPLLHPPKRPWVGLTDKDIKQLVEKADMHSALGDWNNYFARAAEAKLKEKNT